jgi:Xaa-Pro aminopeptidase
LKADLPRLLRDRNLTALLIPVDEVYSPMLDYVTGGAAITGGLVIQPLDAAPVIIAKSMEIEEAAHTGLAVRTMAEMGFYDLYKQNDNNPERTQAAFWVACLRQLDVAPGRIGLYGTGRLHHILALHQLLADLDAEYVFVGESGTTLFDEAMLTKDATEIARIRTVAEHTNAVMAKTWDFIQGHHAQAEAIVNDAGDPLTIGRVRRFVLKALLDHDLEDTGMIFAQGRDAGYPHSRGQDDMPLQLGQSIVFDLFPRERGGGYHHDMTRTWCLGYAPEPVQQAYDQVMQAIDIAEETFGVGKPTHRMQEAVQDYFEAAGHPTQRSKPGTQRGYVHGLGHGLGLSIHERPRISHLSQQDQFAVGNVITIEPGLYYPEDGYGVRVEDTYIVTPAGELESISDFHKKLVMPITTS